MKKVLFLSYYFPPFGGVEVMRAAKLCKYLPEHGWEPVVLSTAVEATLEGRMAHDTQHVTVERTSFPILRGPSAGSVHKSRHFVPDWVKRLLKTTVMFPDRHYAWIKQALQMMPELRSKHPDIQAVFATGYPWSAFILADSIADQYGVPFVLDFRDAWTLNPIPLWNTGRHRKLERRLLSRASAATFTTKAMLEDYKAVYPERHTVFHLLRNGFDPADRSETSTVTTNQRLKIVYTGTFNGHTVPPDDNKQSPYYFFLALKQLQETVPNLDKKIQVVFAGKTPFSSMVENLGLSNLVSFIGHKSHQETVLLQESADLLLLFLGASNRSVVPAKAYEYIASRKPIMALIPLETELHQIMTEYGNTRVIHPKDVDGIVHQLKCALEQFDQSRNVNIGSPDGAFVDSFSRKRQARQLAAILEEVT